MNTTDYHIIVGLDLSFNSTGITIINCVNSNAQTIRFTRMVYAKDTKDFNRPSKPIGNVNILKYKLPDNFDYKSLTLDDVDPLSEDEYLSQEDIELSESYNIDQLFITTKLLINSKRIFKVVMEAINDYCTRYNIEKHQLSLSFNLEGNVLGGNDIMGKNQLRVTGGLIMLNHEIRRHIIDLSLSKQFKNIKLFITSPTELKMYFANNGSASKLDMVETFINKWDGKKLIPSINNDVYMVSKLNDIVDSFALGVVAYHKTFIPQSYIDWLKIRSGRKLKSANKKPKVKRVKVEPMDLFLNSLPTITS